MTASITQNITTKFQPGDAVIVQRGRRQDCCGRVSRACRYTGMMWLHLDKYANHHYASLDFGPFFSSELTFNPALQEQQQKCLLLNT